MRAFAPASVTTVFAPSGESEDRSSGASLALADGVTVELAPAGGTRVTVDGDPAPFDPVEGVLDRLDVTAAVDVRPAVPLGCGFGASGAATLATALAADRAFGLDRDREELVWTAHRAEVAAGTGLGDVFVQEQGGVVTSGPDGPQRSTPATTVAYDSFGGIATEAVLADEGRMARIREHGTAALAELSGSGLRTLFSVGWKFARATGLVTDRVRSTVEAVEAGGGAATMAMVGETVVGVGAGPVLEHETRIATEGARVLAGDGPDHDGRREFD